MDFIDQYSILELTDTRGAEPIEGAEISISGVVLGRHGNVEDTALRLKPTDQSGHTIVPVSTVREYASAVILHAAVDHAGTRETLDLEWRDGAEVTGNHFTLRIVQMEAPAPPPPVLRAIEGSNPPIIEVNSHIVGFGICSNETRQVVWRITTGYVTGPYVDQVSVGAVPDGFKELMWEAIGYSGECPITQDPPPPPGSFTAYVIPPFEYTFYLSQPYCLTDNGAVEQCSD